VGNDFLCRNEKLTELHLPNLRKRGIGFLCYNKNINKINNENNSKKQSNNGVRRWLCRDGRR
jgi:hypothetical protein